MKDYLIKSDVHGGYVATAQQMYDLSVDWYRGRMDEAWTPFNPAEASAVFARHGLTGEFWMLT
jgi:hypothetical protein